MGTGTGYDFGVRCFILMGLAFLVAFPTALDAQGLKVSGEETNPGAESAEEGFNPGLRLAAFFRDSLSSVDGDRCPSYPTCSSYSASAFRKHGFFIGWVMTVDRLIHEGREETAVSPLVYHGGRPRIFDPVENNDFWWYPHDPKGDR